MKLHEYPQWKQTGIDWLAQVPEHWNLRKFRFMFRLGRGLGITKSNLIDEGVPCVSYGEIHSKFGFEVVPEKHKLKCVSEDYLENNLSALLNHGDFVYADTSEDIEGSGNFTHLNSSVPIFAGYHTVTAKPTTNNHSKFLAYLFDSELFRFQIRKFVSGVKVFSVTQDILKNCYIWLPPTDEQTQIAKFLDYKIAQIDRLIEKKKALIEKLGEQRIALITHAVTKGLNPNAPMKDSGIEWLGKVPEHWEVLSIKRLTPVKRGASPRPIQDQKYFDDYGEYSWVRIADVTANDHYLVNTYQALSELGKSLSVPLEPGRLFLSIAGSVGKPMITNIKCCIHDGFVYFPYYDHSQEFLYYIFYSGQPYLGLGKLGTQLNLNTDTVGDIKISLPPRQEQQEIVEYLHVETKKLDRMCYAINSAINKLNEYRTALITAAVTGKIDVRQFEVPEE